MKKVITLFSIVMLLLISIPNSVAQNNQDQQEPIENSVDEVTYSAVKVQTKYLGKLLNLSERQQDGVMEILLHEEVDKSSILENEIGEKQEKMLVGVAETKLERLSHVFNSRQFILYKEWLESN